MWRSLLHVRVTLADPGSLLSVSTSLLRFCLVGLWCVAMIRLHTVHPSVFPAIDDRRGSCLPLSCSLSDITLSSFEHRGALGAKRLHCAEALSSPRRTSTQPGTFHYLRQTLPFRGTLAQHETGTSSLSAPNASLAQKSRSCQFPPVQGQRIPQHFSPEQHEV